ncbi:hypothetical protein H4R34_000120 [Dimargaris verticillata]|uniref:Protein kinase domain-containing protein n=1 Tax=Dimargaris verticillata TaxID=2761393 RepID=A0A9W8EC68_9FUNG|nr:hypothetical protein H4R34_000120 [Dimargaris verticillata]
MTRSQTVPHSFRGSGATAYDKESPFAVFPPTPPDHPELPRKPVTPLDLLANSLTSPPMSPGHAEANSGLRIPYRDTASPVSPAAGLEPNTQYTVRFTVSETEFLGAGRLAKVYRATACPTSGSLDMTRSCVVKLIEAYPATNPLACDAWQAGLNEARILAQLQRNIIAPHLTAASALPADHCVVRLLGVAPLSLPVQGPTSLTGNQSFTMSQTTSQQFLDQPLEHSYPEHHRHFLVLVLENCEYGSLWSWVSENREEVGLALWLQWARQLALALQTIHSAGVAHYDIKPHNILLTADLDLRLADFSSAIQVLVNGVARDVTQHGQTSQFASVGTVAYTAPELLNPVVTAKPVNGTPSPPPRRPAAPLPLHLKQTDQPAAMASDIFSTGILFFIAGISGREPYAWTRSPMELMLAAMKGAFWDCEMQRARLAGAPTRTRSLNRRPNIKMLATRGEAPALPAEDDKDTAKRSLATRHPRLQSLRPIRSLEHLPIESAPVSPVRPTDSTAPTLASSQAEVTLTMRPSSQPKGSVAANPSTLAPLTTTTPQRPLAQEPPSPATRQTITQAGNGIAGHGLPLPPLFFLNGDPVPIRVAELIQAMTIKNPNQRPAACDVVHELDAIAKTYLIG